MMAKTKLRCLKTSVRNASIRVHANVFFKIENSLMWQETRILVLHSVQRIRGKMYSLSMLLQGKSVLYN
jgi:hypothetical protein